MQYKVLAAIHTTGAVCVLYVLRLATTVGYASTSCNYCGLCIATKMCSLLGVEVILRMYHVKELTIPATLLGNASQQQFYSYPTVVTD